MWKNSFLILGVASATLLLNNAASGQTWTNIPSPYTDDGAVACSADGGKIILGGRSSWIFQSTNSGATWTTNIFPLATCYSIATSADEGKIFVGAGGLFISTNSGLNWTTNSQSTQETYVTACSPDGTKVVVSTAFGGVIVSTNSGSTFVTNTVPKRGLYTIALAAGGIMYATDQTRHIDTGYNTGPIYRSTDFGTTWTPLSAPTNEWVDLACSADGQTVIAVGGPLAISRDFGNTWTTNNQLPVFTVVACSADATRIIAAQGNPNGYYPGSLFTSLDSGETWVTNNTPPYNWTGLAMSADGSIMFGSTSYYPSAGLLTARLPAQPSLKIAPSGSNLQFSWPLPSAGFVLQQSSRLTGTNWFAVTNAVVPCGYYNQVTIPPPSAGNAYYRLANQ
jgi:photosystem II stability/assembly factor-like uncharacterized protein